MGLINLIWATHYLKASCIDPEKRAFARRRWKDLKMNSLQTIGSFKEAFVEGAEMLDQAGIPLTERQMAEEFLEKLHDGYEGLRIEQIRGVKTGTLECLKNRYQLAFMYAPSVKPQATTSTVFNMQEIQKAIKEKVTDSLKEKGDSYKDKQKIEKARLYTCIICRKANHKYRLSKIKR